MSLPTGSSVCLEVAYESVCLLAALPTREFDPCMGLPTGGVCYLLGVSAY